MKTVTWKVVLTDDNRIASMTEPTGLPSEKIESHIFMVGLLENMKHMELHKITPQYQKTIKRQEDDFGL